jgi:hypothetical protein
LAGASKTLDPIAAAEADIAGSRDLMAAVARDLGQHERWLAHYHVSEKRHARRVMVHELIYRIELARQSLLRLLGRVSLRLIRLARAAALFLWRTAVACFSFVRRIAILTYEWLRPRTYTLALTLWQWLAAFFAWTAAKARMLARNTWEWLCAFSAWLVATARVLAHRSWVRLSAFSAWLFATTRVIALRSWVRFRAFSAWLVATLRVLAQRSWALLCAFSAWAIMKSRAIAGTVREWGSIGALCLAEHARLAANATEKRLARSWAWTARISGIVARASADGAATASASVMEQSRRLARATKKNTVRGALMAREASDVARARAQALTRAARHAGSTGLAWSLSKAQTLVRAARRPGPEPDSNHSALVVRRCTALICVEPRRDRLPALRAG